MANQGAWVCKMRACSQNMFSECQLPRAARAGGCLVRVESAPGQRLVAPTWGVAVLPLDVSSLFVCP